ncbi:AAA family ATPase [Streptomyces sp. NPDC088725]|uniref:AAA family ATPase n=1 Tax=Streptomyces sp. NPDC088725 TaxID=3365873 RepID=UPI00380EC879
MVTRPVRIGILGTHSTGKTDLMKRIEMELRGHGLAAARTGRLAKRAARLGWPKMQHHTALSTEWIITQGVADELAMVIEGADVVLADRAPLDALAYYTAALEFRGENPTTPNADRLRRLAATQTPQYDLLIATVLDTEIHVDQSHDYDMRYRALVDQHTHQLLHTQNIPHLRATSDRQTKNEIIESAVNLALKKAAA